MRILVLDGGGQLGAFEWGAMCELHRLGIDYLFFDYYITTSAGAFNACFFLAEQFEEGKRIWLEHLPNGFWKPFKNDMAYLEKILTQIEPLNCGAVASRKEKIYATLANVKTKIMEILDGQNNFKIIRPEKALPIGFRSNNKVLIKQSFALGEQAANKFFKCNLKKIS